MPTPGLAEFRRRRPASPARTPVVRAARFRRRRAGRLDLDRLRAAIGPATRAIFINSPSNPTGWTASEDELRAILADRARARALDHRRRGLQPLRLRRRERAPSFYDVDGGGRPHHLRQHLLQELGDDRLAHRLDLARRRALGGGDREPDPVFDLRRRRLHAARRGRGARGRRGFRAPAGRARAARAARSSAAALAGSNRVRFAWPDGAFYLFFTHRRRGGYRAASACGWSTRRISASRPGTAFGAGGAPFLRLCFRARRRISSEATRRLTRLARKLIAALLGRLSRRDHAARRDHARHQRRRRACSRSCSGMPAGWVAGGLLAVAVASLAGVNTDVSARLHARRSSSSSASIPARGVTQETLHQMQTWPASFAILGALARRADRRLLLVAAQPLRLGRGTTRCSPRCPARCPSSSRRRRA